MAIKHVGRMANNQRKVVVAYRVVPGDGEHENAVVVTTENLDSADHDVLMKTVESDAAQAANEFAEVMARTRLSDGRNMLAAFHTTGKMVKVKQADVEMTPDTRTVINLAELNKIIAEQKGVTVADLAVTDDTTSKKPRQVVAENIDLDKVDVPPQVVEAAEIANNQVLTDEEMAAKYRSDADRMFKEAQHLRKMAEELVPSKKKAKVKSEESA
jgi:hypothetical protein